MSFTQVTVTATLSDNTAKGYITFVPTASISNGGVQAPILPKKLTLTAGTGSLVLNAGDDVGTSPSGSGYRVTEYITGATPRTYVVQLSKNATAVNLGDLAPSTATPFYSYVQTTQLGAASGVATLGSDGYLSAAQRPMAFGIPSYAGTGLQNCWDNTFVMYNNKGSNTRNMAAGQAKAAAGGDQCEVFLGDSLFAGCVGSTTFDRYNAVSRVYGRLLAGNGVPVAGTGINKINDGSIQSDKWTAAGTWNLAVLATYAFGSSINSTQTWTSDIAGTAVEVWFLTNNSTGQMTVKVDGVTVDTIAAGGPAGGVLNRRQYTGLANTTHTVVFTQTTATGVLPQGAGVFTPNGGLTVHNFAQSGSFAANPAAGTYANWSNLADLVGGLRASNGNPVQTRTVPTAVHVNIGTNDINVGQTPAQIIAGIQVMVGLFNRSVTDLVLHLNPQPNENGAITPAMWDAFSAAMYAYADTSNAVLIDYGQRFGYYAQYNANGLAGDAIAHLNKGAYYLWALNAARALS